MSWLRRRFLIIFHLKFDSYFSLCFSGPLFPLEFYCSVRNNSLMWETIKGESPVLADRREDDEEESGQSDLSSFE